MEPALKLPKSIEIDCSELNVGFSSLIIPLSKKDIISKVSFRSLISSHSTDDYMFAVLHQQTRKGHYYCYYDSRSLFNEILGLKIPSVINLNGSDRKVENIFFYVFNRRDHSLTYQGHIKEKSCVDSLSECYPQIYEIAKKVREFKPASLPNRNRKEKNKVGNSEV